MCKTCDSIKIELLVRKVCVASQARQAGISYEGTQKLSRFVKKTLLEAKNDINQVELLTILKDNNPDKISSFIIRHVKDFPEKFHKFVYREILE